VGELSPRAARFEGIQDGVDDFAQGVVSGVSACFGFVAVEGALENEFGDCPFVVGWVCLVGFSRDGLLDEKRCDWVLFCRVVRFGCYHSG